MQKKMSSEIILLLLLTFEVDGGTNLHGSTIVQDYTGCINNLIEKNFDKPGLVIFGDTYNATYSVVSIRANILKAIHASVNFSVEIKTASDHTGVCSGSVEEDNRVLNRDHFQTISNADYFVIITDDFQDFIYIASKLIRSRSWNPQAKFFVIFLNFTYKESESVQYIENILTCLFRFNAINVIVLIPQPGKFRNALLYSWRPYDPPKYCGYFNESAKNRVILENICEHGVIKKNMLMFYDKIPTDMRKCVINVLAIERQPYLSTDDADPNIEKVLISAMLKLFNLTVKYKILDEFRGEKNVFGLWTGALNRLAAKEGQILLGGIYPDNEVHEDFECSSSYLSDSYTWVVPLAPPSPPWMALTGIFSHVVWFVVGAIFLLCVLSWKIIGFMSDESKYNKSFAHNVLNTFIVTLGSSTYIRPLRGSLRIFFVFLNLYGILLVTCYQTKLIQVLQNPTSENQVDTIQELVESGLKFGGTEELRDLFLYSNDTFDKTIYDKWVVVEYLSDALINVAVHRNFSVLCSRLELAFLSAILPDLRDRFGHLQYYAFKSNTFSVPAEMLALRGFPFMIKFSDALRSYLQLGFNVAVRRRFARFILRMSTKLLLSLHVQCISFRPLSIHHLQGGFLILILGMTGGSLVLLFEIILNCKCVKDYFRNKKNII